MNIRLERAIDALGVYTAKRFDIWALAGPAKASCRAHVMSELAGKKMPQSQSGVTAIRSAFYDAMQIHGTCEAERENKFISECRAINGGIC